MSSDCYDGKQTNFYTYNFIYDGLRYLGLTLFESLCLKSSAAQTMSTVAAERLEIQTRSLVAV